MIISGGGIATSHMKNRITKKNGMGSSKTKRCTSPANKEGTDHVNSLKLNMVKSVLGSSMTKRGRISAIKEVKADLWQLENQGRNSD